MVLVESKIREADVVEGLANEATKETGEKCS